LRTPFFPARHAGLPDLIGPLLPRVAELEVDGPKLLSLRHVHCPLDHLADLRLDPRPQLVHNLFDALFTALFANGSKGTLGHDQTPDEMEEVFPSYSLAYCPAQQFPPK